MICIIIFIILIIITFIFFYNQLINQLYSTLRATAEATNYAMFADNLLRYCVEKLIVLWRCGPQLQFFKSIANERSAPAIVADIFGTSFRNITGDQPVPYCK